MGTREMLRIAELLELLATYIKGDKYRSGLIDEAKGYAAQLREEASE